MNDTNCGNCANCHFTNSNKNELLCIKRNGTVSATDVCVKFKRSVHDEKLVLNSEFIRVLRLLQIC